MARRKNVVTVEPVCGFCGRTQKEVGMLVEGKLPNHYICTPCAKLSMDILERETKKRSKKSSLFSKILTPREIVEHLDQFVIEQSYAKRVMAVSVHNHYKRLLTKGDEDVVIDKSNLLLLGKTGVGKSLIAKTIAKIINVPFAIGDATTLTEAGYVGDDVESLLLKLLRASNMDVELTEMGIIYIDEIDKLAKSRGNVSITKDVSGEGVQQGLLKMLEGTVASVPPQGGRKHPEQKCIEIDTTNILFVCGGTFVGLDDIISRRIGKKRMGFGGTSSEEEKDDVMKSLLSEDLVEFGLIPEFIGRLPVVAPLHDLNEETLLRVLTEPRNSLVKQYKKLFAMEESELEFTPEALKEIVQLAKKQETGARGLRGIVDKIMLDIMFELPEQGKGKHYLITDSVVRGENNNFFQAA
jgi:ATP-dependent Clp protease ATP-binding subunit ClpX